MFSTIVLAVIIVSAMLISVVLWALLLGVGLRWAKVPGVTWRGIVLATVVVTILEITVGCLIHVVSQSSHSQSAVLYFVEMSTGIAIPCAAIIAIFKIKCFRAVQAWLPTLLASVTMLSFSLLVLRPFLFETFVIPTNAMAPTLIGQHWRGTCPTCGKPNYCTARDERIGAVDTPLMICGNFHVTETPDVDRTVHSGDRIIAAKYLTPRRWDMVVFQYPEDPSSLYVKRLVGFPGETIHIQEESVWVDGKRLTPPESVGGIRYLAEPAYSFGAEAWGSIDRPAVLANDEYFVLGDFSAHSMDSRVWMQGAPGHNPFAVPESHMKGVVTHTYWPLDRCRIHR